MPQHEILQSSVCDSVDVTTALPIRVLLVVTTRQAPLSGEVVQLLNDLVASGAQAIHLQPVSAEDVALASEELGASSGPELTAALAKASGNPLWVMAMVHSLSDERMLRRDGELVEVTLSELPDSLRERVVRRLRYQRTATLELLQVTAVLGDAVAIRDIAAVTRRPPAEIVAQLTDAFRRSAAR